MSLDVNELIKRYEDIDNKVTSLKNDVQRDEMELHYSKKDLKEKMDTLKEKGIDFNNVSDLEGKLDNLKTELDEILNSTRRKLDEA